MADGTRKQIQNVKIGDMVLVADPKAGMTGSQPVVDVIEGHGEKTLVRVTVDTDGPKGNRTGLIITTDEHPFWDAKQHHWTNAGDLRPGTHLHTPSGATMEVVGIWRYTQVQNVYNLTVAGPHTFYVAAGDADVLVHNADCEDWARKFQARNGGK